MKLPSLLRISVLVVICIVVLAGCSGNKTPQLNAIPDSAKMVISVNLHDLIVKLSPSQLRNYDFMKAAEQEQPGKKKEDTPENKDFNNAIDRIVKSPKESGVAITELVYGFALKDDQNEIRGVSVGVTDKGRFSEMVHKLAKASSLDQKGFEKGNGYEVFSSPMGFAVAWDNNKAIVLLMDKGDQDLKAFAGDIMSGKTRSITENPKFQPFMEGSGDLGIWAASDMMVSSKEAEQALIDGGVAYKDNYLMAYLKLGTGEATIEGELFPNEQLAKYFDESLRKEGISSELLGEVPAQSIGAFGVALDMPKMFEMIKAEGNWDEVNQHVSENFLPLELMLQMLNGEMVFSLNDMRKEMLYVTKIDFENDTSYVMPMGEVFAPYLYSAHGVVEGKTDFFEGMTEENEPTKVGNNNYYKLHYDPPITFYKRGSDLVVSTDEKAVAQSLKGELGTGLAGTGIGKRLQEEPFLVAFNPDVSSYPEAIKTAIEGELPDEIMIQVDGLTNVAEWVEVTAPTPTTFVAKLTMKDKGKNVVKTMLEAYNNTFLALREFEAKQEAEMKELEALEESMEEDELELDDLELEDVEKLETEKQKLDDASLDDLEELDLDDLDF